MTPQELKAANAAMQSLDKLVAQRKLIEGALPTITYPGTDPTTTMQVHVATAYQQSIHHSVMDYLNGAIEETKQRLRELGVGV